MDIKFVGTWWFRDIHLCNSSALVTLYWKKILVDCWAWVYKKIIETDTIDSIDYFLLTHLHWDHTWNLFHFLCHKWSSGWLNLIYVNEYHKKELSWFLTYWCADRVDTLVNRIPIQNVTWVSAIDTNGQHFPWIQTYWYYFEEEGEWYYFSWDLWNITCTLEFIANLDLNEISLKIFHDVRLWSKIHWHCHYKELQEDLSEYEVYWYHCDHTHKPIDCTLELVANHSKYML